MRTSSEVLEKCSQIKVVAGLLVRRACQQSSDKNIYIYKLRMYRRLDGNEGLISCCEEENEQFDQLQLDR